MTTAPQKIAVRRLVRGADGAMKIILVDAYSYAPVADATGYKVVDVGDVPEQVQDVNQPDAEKPVKTQVDKITTGSTQRGGSEFGSSSRGNQNSSNFGRVPSVNAPSHAQAFPGAPSVRTPSTPSTTPGTPSVGSNMPTQDSVPSSPDTPSTPANPPGYSQPSQGSTPQNYSPATPNAAAFAAGNQYYTGTTKTYDFQNPNSPATSTPSNPDPTNSGLGQGLPSGTNVSVNNGITSTTSTDAGTGAGASASGTASFGSFGSGNNNGRGKGISPSVSTSPSTSYGSMYGDAGFGGGYTPSDTSVARSTVDAASAPKSATERSQAMGSVPDSATSPAAAAARGLVSRTPAELDKMGLTIAGEVTGQTLANLSSPDPEAQAEARAQVANIQTTMENRAATAPWGSIAKAVVPGQYDALNPGQELTTSKNNFAKYNAAIMSTVKDFYTGLNPPTNYNFTNYANTNAIPGKYTPPGWLNTIQDPTQVGPFTFGTDPAYANPSRFTPEAQANYSAAQADYGAAGAYQKSPDYGTDPGWGSYRDEANPTNGYSYGAGYGQSAVDPGWGSFAGATETGGGYVSSSGNNNGRGSGIAGGSSNYGGATSYGGGSGYGGGGSYGGSGSSYGGGSGMSGGGGYSPGGMGSPSGSSNDGGGYGGSGGIGGYGGTSSGSEGNNSGTSTGSGAGTNGSGGSKGAQGRSEGDY